jgi:hypothetical protein
MLAGAAAAWFAVAACGQAIFLLYILMLYGVSLFTCDHDAWSRMMPRGTLQLIPAIRTRYRVFHCWNGRVYLVTVTVATLTGLWMVWNRSQLGGIVRHSAMTNSVVRRSIS